MLVEINLDHHSGPRDVKSTLQIITFYWGYCTDKFSVQSMSDFYLADRKL